MNRTVRSLALALAGITTAVVAVVVSGAPPAHAQAACTFQLGFATLRNMVGAATVGDCLQNEGFNSANGNAEQRTARGLLVWRKADNWTAFTDGYRTWINGPTGLQERLNTDRFPWEPPTPSIWGCC